MLTTALLLSAFLVGPAPRPAPQTDLCAQVSTTLTVKAGQVLTAAIVLPQHAAVFPAGSAWVGQPVVTEYAVGFFPANQSNVSPIGATTTLPKSAFTAAPPGANCFTFTMPPVPALPSGEYAIGVLARFLGSEGPWTYSVNPFVLAPPAPGALGRLVILK